VNELYKAKTGKKLYRKKDFENLITQTQHILSTAPQIKEVAKQHRNIDRIFILGKGLDMVLAYESALKVKETTQKHCEGFALNEFKHGPISMVDENTLTIILETDKDQDQSKIEIMIATLTSKGSKIWRASAHEKSPLSFVTGAVPLQLFSLYLSMELGLDPDKPRNLTKSVM
jgi:glucosamine--fructose-6-phosphate aminotransferase (isomerizing)